MWIQRCPREFPILLTLELCDSFSGFMVCLIFFCQHSSFSHSWSLNAVGFRICNLFHQRIRLVSKSFANSSTSVPRSICGLRGLFSSDQACGWLYAVRTAIYPIHFQTFTTTIIRYCYLGVWLPGHGFRIWNGCCH